MASDTRPTTTRVFPSIRRNAPVSVPLSILDATCARFANTGALWVFDSPQDGPAGEILINHLKSSFISTLDLFPQWAGQLHFAPFRLDGKHTERFNRPMITYGSESDPGVEWGVVRHEFDVKSFVPDSTALSSGSWSGDSFPQEKLAPSGKLALYNLKDYEGLPCMLIQINLFSCGGYAIGVRLAHSVADAQSMLLFVHDWAARCRSELGDPCTSPFEPAVFNPQLLDSRAAGDIDSSSPDEFIIDEARALPLNRFDWWETDAPGYSPYLVASSKNSIPPPEVLSSIIVSPSTTGPWESWDLSRPISLSLLHFTGDELSAIRESARRDAPGRGEISRLDALLAHLYILITRAREYTQSPEDEVFLEVTLDARRRVSPALPETFLGSPLLMTHIKDSASAVRNASVGDLALRLRQTMKLFTPEKMAAVLHDAAFEVSPQRLWLGFMGTLHVLVSSWQRLRVYDVDFAGHGRRPAYVHAILQKCDGLLMVLDPITEDGGVDVALYLDSDTMPRLLDVLQKSRSLS